MINAQHTYCRFLTRSGSRLRSTYDALQPTRETSHIAVRSHTTDDDIYGSEITSEICRSLRRCVEAADGSCSGRLYRS